MLPARINWGIGGAFINEKVCCRNVWQLAFYLEMLLNINSVPLRELGITQPRSLAGAVIPEHRQPAAHFPREESAHERRESL